MWVQARLHRLRGEDEEAREVLTKALLERPGSLTVQKALWQSFSETSPDWTDFGGLLDTVAVEAGDRQIRLPFPGGYPGHLRHHHDPGHLGRYG